MLVKLFAPILMIGGFILVLSGQGVGFLSPGFDIFLAGSLLAAIYGIKSGLLKSRNKLFLGSLVCFGITLVGVISVTTNLFCDGYGCFIWAPIMLIAGLLGLVLLIISLFVRPKLRKMNKQS